MGLASPGGRVRPGSRSRRFAVLLATTIALSACHLDTFTFGAGDDTSDAGPIDDGGVDDGGGGGDARPPADAMPDACVAFVETCNEADDDCDGMVDEDFNLDADPANCGSCGARCQEPNTAGTCSAGQCSYACLPGYDDTDMLAFGPSGAINISGGDDTDSYAQVGHGGSPFGDGFGGGFGVDLRWGDDRASTRAQHRRARR